MQLKIHHLQKLVFLVHWDIYIVLLFLLDYMKKKDYKYELKTVLMYYNLVQIMLNSYIIYGTYYIILYLYQISLQLICLIMIV